MSVPKHESGSKHNSILHDLHYVLVVAKAGFQLARNEKFVCHVVQHHIEWDLHQYTYSQDCPGRRAIPAGLFCY